MKRQITSQKSLSCIPFKAFLSSLSSTLFLEEANTSGENDPVHLLPHTVTMDNKKQKLADHVTETLTQYMGHEVKSHIMEMHEVNQPHTPPNAHQDSLLGSRTHFELTFTFSAKMIVNYTRGRTIGKVNPPTIVAYLARTFILINIALDATVFVMVI